MIRKFIPELIYFLLIFRFHHKEYGFIKGEIMGSCTHPWPLILCGDQLQIGKKGTVKFRSNFCVAIIPNAWINVIPMDTKILLFILHKYSPKGLNRILLTHQYLSQIFEKQPLHPPSKFLGCAYHFLCWGGQIVFS